MNLRLKAKMQTNSSIITKILDDNDRKDINKLTKIFKEIVSLKKTKVRLFQRKHENPISRCRVNLYQRYQF